MDGKRFGLGLAAGLLVGLAVIVGSGTVGSNQFSLGTLAASPAQGNQNHGEVTSTTTAFGATTITAVSTSTSVPPGYVVNPSSNATTSTSTSSSTSSVSQKGSNNSLDSAVSAIPPAPSSRFASIAQQPVLSNAVVLVPVIVAFVLGAILYRASSRNKETEDGEE